VSAKAGWTRTTSVRRCARWAWSVPHPRGPTVHPVPIFKLSWRPTPVAFVRRSWSKGSGPIWSCDEPVERNSG